MQNFDLKHIPNLDICVLGALEMLADVKLPKINIQKNKRIIVIGSGNALATGRIIFKDYDSVFANESNYKDKLKNAKFNLAVLVSASGGKHAPLIAKYLKKKRIDTILLTNNKKAKAIKFVDKTIVFPKQREPYTYNVSTYLSMILSKTRENPVKIYNYIKKTRKLIPENLKNYRAIYMIVPSKFEDISELFGTKFDELFGPMIAADIFTEEQTKHAKTLVPSRKELFIGLGYKNRIYGYPKNRLNIHLEKNADYGGVIAIGYYIIGKIQEQNRNYFKENLIDYTKKASKIFKEKINPIVEQ